jgi:hypothetical protein
MLGWEKDVEVVEPKVLRNQMAHDIQALNDIYNAGNKPVKENDADSGNSGDKSLNITVKQWKAIVPLLPPQPRTGRPGADDRQTINGILRVLELQNEMERYSPAIRRSFHLLYPAETMKKQGVWANINNIISPDGPKE